MSTKVLLDTNVVIHREAFKVSHQAVGQLYRWLEELKCTKCIHPITAAELASHKNAETVRSMGIKLESYYILKTQAPVSAHVQDILDRADKNDNDRNDTLLLNEVVEDRVDTFITEDRKIHEKAAQLGVASRVFNISGFVEKAVADNPELVNYKVLSVEKAYFGNVDLKNEFFDSFRADYAGFDKWFSKNADKVVYVCNYNKTLIGFLYLKIEGPDENYADIEPVFTKKKRLKIGTFKVALNGYRVGERFLKIVFDNALVNKVAEIYVTIFDHTPEQLRLIDLLEEWGFTFRGYKSTPTGKERVYIRDFTPRVDALQPKLTFPYMSRKANVLFVPIWPDYHTKLLPDSILNTESPEDYKDNEPDRNSLSKVYISHSHERGLTKGDVIVFYRTGGKYAGVVTTLGIVEHVHHDIQSAAHLFDICRKKTFFRLEEVKAFFDRYQETKPFVVEFLYTYSFPKRPNLAKLVELGIIPDIMSVPRGFSKISWDHLFLILKESKSNESLIIN